MTKDVVVVLGMKNTVSSISSVNEMKQLGARQMEGKRD